MTKHVFLITILLLTTSPSVSQSVTERAAKDEVVIMSDEEPAMRKAFEKARLTLSDFLTLANSKNAALADFAVKVGIKEGPDTEYFWIINFRETAGRFSGEIANEPRLVKTVKIYQKYSFGKSEIIDWTYFDTTTNRMHGNFTLCALLTKEPESEARSLRDRLKLDCSFLSK